jgi:hypothetical protein
MTVDVLFYAPDVAAVIPELAEKLPQALTFDEEGNPTGYSVAKFPPVRTANQQSSLTLARLTETEWQEFQDATIASLQVLASGVDPIGQILNGEDADKRALYRSLWPEIWSTTDEDGETVTVPNVPRFGGFAGDTYV